jgi:hypothetical protein
MTNQSFDEKNEKDEKDEKEVDKREEKTAEEKWRRDPLGSITWAAILIWAGLVFLVQNLNPSLLTSLSFGIERDETVTNFDPRAWTIILIGAGIILLVQVVVRLVMPAYRSPVGGSLILAAILLGSGLGNIFGWELVGPLVIIAIGVSILLRGSWRRR